MIHRLSQHRALARCLGVYLLTAMVSIGCGGGAGSGKGKSKPTVSAAGKVEYDGKALALGVISFTSKDTGNQVSCPVKEGAYSCDKDAGPNPGENAVLITGKESADGPVVWSWASKVNVPEAGLTDGNFTVDAKKAKKAPKPNPDDI